MEVHLPGCNGLRSRADRLYGSFNTLLSNPQCLVDFGLVAL